MNESVAGNIFHSLRYCIYAIHPNETYFTDYDDAPDFNSKAAPGMLVLVLLEFLFAQKVSWRLHTTIVNLSCGGLAEACKNFALRGVEYTLYFWVYDKYRFFDFSWNSPYTFLLTFLGVDFGYYIWHKASHETSIMWALHYVHHSSEDFNLSVSFRSSASMRLVLWIYFMYMAFIGIPPVIYLVHKQLGLTYSAWVHSDSIPKLGKIIPGIGDVIEFIIVTPSHHRVHHASNHYCIDKNYGQVLIIWDRIFGTFAEEKDDEPLTYGTIDNKKTQHILYLQIHPILDLWERVKSMKTTGDKLRALFYGPGWEPGKPRLGDPKDIPDVRGRPKNQLILPRWLSYYVAWHGTLVFYTYVEMMGRIKTQGDWVPELNLSYIFISLAALGGVYDSHRYTVWLEPLRLLYYVFLLNTYPVIGSTSITTFLTYNHLLSLLFCPLVATAVLKSIRDTGKDKVIMNGHNGFVNGEIEGKIKVR